MTPKDELRIIDDYHGFRHDPYRFVMYTFPWGHGELKDHLGPRIWQKNYLLNLGMRLRRGNVEGWQAIQEAVSSGHGVGKSALVAWLILWALYTFEDTRCVITANTDTQLRTKTWPELSKWHRLSLTSHWFVFTATSLYSFDKKHEKSWRADMIPWSIHNTEAFAGLHNHGKRILLIFDEASSIPDKIWEVTEGALTDEDTEIVWAVFGNPTRNTGRFRECFGRFRSIWGNTHVDSRDVQGTNKIQLQILVNTYGEDSDYVRVRVRGLFPRASSLQLIASDVVFEAQRREARCNLNDPLIMAVDMARGGDDNCCFRFRRGLDARTIPAVRIPGSEMRDSMRLVSKALQLIEIYKPDAVFWDATGLGGPAADRMRQLGHHVIDVQFGGGSPDAKYLNMRAFMYARLEAWLRAGGAIDDSPILEADLTGVEYDHNAKDQLRLESKEHMKERGLASPDDADALAMTFAFPVAPTMGPNIGHGKMLSEWRPE